MSRLWVEIGISPYDNFQIIAYRLDNGLAGLLMDGALWNAEHLVDLYNYGGTSYSAIFQELDIDEKDFVPIDNPLQVKN